MNTKKQIILSAQVITLLFPVLPGALEVRQELYTYRLEMVRDVTTDTFVITRHSQFKEKPAISCRLSLVYFELGSATLSPTTAAALLLDLKRCVSLKKYPLQVIGHACHLGSEKYNQFLSLQRARSVADFLQKHGISVVAVQGKGSQQPITDDFQELYKNRRVEITI